MILADMHMHSARSDGTDTPEELLKIIRKRGIACFSLTDHDTIAGCAEMDRLAVPADGFVRGVELSCKTALRKCHVLGYAYDPCSEAMRTLMTYVAEMRLERLETRLRFMEEAYGIVFSEAEKNRLRHTESVGKPHIASLLIEKGYAASIGEAIKNYLSSKDMQDGNLPAESGIRAILAAGGIPVWAHPLGGENARHITPEEFFPQLELLISCGLQGLECYYSRYSAAETAFLVAAAQERGLYISGGSDYHGKRKSIAPGVLSSEGMQVPAQNLTILQEYVKRGIIKPFDTGLQE